MITSPRVRDWIEVRLEQVRVRKEFYRTYRIFAEADRPAQLELEKEEKPEYLEDLRSSAYLVALSNMYGPLLRQMEESP